ncbi:Nuclear pore complex protein [Thalictrum thalictroides]|uniref:Nuclear pore complex protein n=1 Tax=Thalictrum thalictroides TaxID=46969 RepID=A0A7J6W8X7_THATH|nr:Nuclear pore complex protein [Thalictrum thalictroides]
MDIDMEASPSSFDPNDLSIREQFRRYGKRHTSLGNSPHPETPSSSSKILFDGNNIQIRPNAALFLEEIKQEVENFESDGGTHQSSIRQLKRRSLMEDDFAGFDNFSRRTSSPLKSSKIEEDDVYGDVLESTFALFASLLDSSLQKLMTIPDLILRFEKACRNVSESIRYGSNGRHRVVEDKLMRQKARLLLDEAASWSLLCNFCNLAENEELPQDLLLFPTTSHLEACKFVMNEDDHTAQLCLRIVQWLEGLASKALDLENKVRGCYVGSYLPSSGVWHNTQRLLKRGHAAAATVQHLDFDAPTREIAQQHPDDKKQDESLLEDIWTLLRAGRLDEACELCRTAGQACDFFMAATLCPFGGLNLFPSVEALLKNGKSRILQAIELESGIGRQWCLWKWASYNASEKIADQEAGKYEAAIYAAQCSNLKRLLPICTDWESACWAIAKSWLDVQIDLELSRYQPGRLEILRSDGEEIDLSPGHGDEALQSVGTESWPRHVLRQQPRDLSALFQKLHSGDIVHDSVSRGCKEQHRQIEMNLMVGDIPHLLDLLWSWISPSEEYNEFRVHGDPQMIRFGAHLVLVLRYLVDGQIKDAFREKLLTVGDRILHMYAMFLFSKQHEELVGVYASQLARHCCIDLFVYMMELRLEWRVSVKYKIFQSAMEYLPFSPEDDSKGSFEEIIDRVLSRSRETKPRKHDENSLDVAEQHRWQSLQKAMVVQWLCFTPPSTINNAELIKAKLLLKALIHSNTLFREFALISMWRSPMMPKGAHMLLSYLAEPLKQPTDNLFKSFDEFHDSSESLDEFQDWREYYSCDATYRNWLKIEMENEQDPLVSLEERQRAVGAAKETLDSSMLLLQREEFPWMVYVDDPIYESEDPTYLELHATAMLCLPSGECMSPDYALCTALTSALYSSVSEDVVSNRKLMANVSISTTDNFCIEVLLRCLAVEGDGLGRHELNDGGVLATIMATGFKGELVQFRAGVTMEISRLDAWYSNEGLLERPAAYIVRGLCRRCCLPEIILRCMQVSVSLVESGNPPECHDELIDIVASSEDGYLHLFSQHQLQEFLLFEREYSIYKMELEEETLVEDS